MIDESSGVPLVGSFLRAHPDRADVRESRYGQEGQLLGLLVNDFKKQAFHRFDIVTLSEVWDTTKDYKGGRRLMGIAIELAGLESPAGGDRVPPYFHRLGRTKPGKDYLGTEK